MNVSRVWMKGLRAVCSLVIAAGVAASPAAASSGTRATSVTFARLVGADVEAVRDAIADPRWSEWIPFLKSTECTGVDAGSGRVCVMSDPTGAMDGYRINETIVTNDRDRGLFIYDIANPPLPVKDFQGTLVATPEGGATLVTWTADFSVEDASAPAVRAALLDMYRGALDGLEMHARNRSAAVRPAAAAVGQLTLVDLVVLKPGRTLAERDKYEAYIEPIAARYGIRKVQSYDVAKHLTGKVERTARVNIWALPDGDAFAKLGQDPDYLKGIPYRNYVHEMDQVTLHLARASVLAPRKAAGKFLVDLVVMSEGHGLADRNIYSGLIEPIAARHGMRKVYSGDITRHVAGGLPDAVRVNVWSMPTDAAPKALSADPEYLRNVPFRDRIHDMERVTLMLADVADAM